jgi:transcriptional regulator with XRE-family HTH domain
VARPTQWLKNARKRAGFASQAALADAMGVSRGAVGNWENGTDRPSMENAERLAVQLRRQRAEVLAMFGYPIGGGDPAIELPPGLPPEWVGAIEKAVAAGVADGIAQALDALRAEELLGGRDRPGGSSPRRHSA